MIESWNTAIAGLTLRHPNPTVQVRLAITTRAHHVKVLFTLFDLMDSRTSKNMGDFEYYFYVNQWPGLKKARLWILSAWVLLMEHESLELAQFNGSQFADPHTSSWFEAHRTALDRRHDMNYMLSRICGVDISG